LTIDFDTYIEIALSGSVVLKREASLPRGASINFQAGASPNALKTWKV